MSDLMDDAVMFMPYDMAMGSELSRRQFYNRAQSLYRELQAARAQPAAEPEAASPEYQAGWNRAMAICIEAGAAPAAQPAAEPVAELVADMRGGASVKWLSDEYFDPGTKLYVLAGPRP